MSESLWAEEWPADSGPSSRTRRDPYPFTSPGARRLYDEVQPPHTPRQLALEWAWRNADDKATYELIEVVRDILAEAPSGTSAIIIGPFHVEALRNALRRCDGPEEET